MGTWYRTGTVVVTNGSPNVVGTGTLWASQAAVGDIFIGPDLVDYEITSITDDTHLAIKQKSGTASYAGSTLSAQAYAIIRNFTSTLPAQLASQLAALMTSYHVTMDELTAWLSGTGSVTVHDAVGNAYTVQTPAALAATIGGRLSKSVAGGSNVTLTSTEASNLFIELTGTLTANINVIVPATARSFFFYNATSGAYTITVKTAGGTGVAVPQGGRVLVECDGTNVVSPLTNMPGGLTVNGDQVISGALSAGSASIAGAISVSGEISTPVGDTQALVLGKNQGGGAKLSYNTGTGNLDVTPRSGYNVHVVGGNFGIGVAPTNGWGVLQVSGAANNALFAMYDTTANKVSYFLKTSGATPGRLDHYATYLGTGIDVYHAWWVTKSSGSQSQGMTLSSNSEFLVNTIANTNNYRAVFESNGSTNGIEFRDTATSGSVASGFTSRFTQAAGTGFAHYSAVSGGSAVMQVLGNGNIQNANNSYGAISDLKLKQDIVDAKSQWADVKALTVRKFRFKSDPTGFLMMGLIAQEAEAVSPGLVETTDDFEDVVVEPARTEVKIVQRQKTQKVTVEQPTPTLVDGRYVLRMVPTEIDAPLIEEHPLFAEDGSPLMEIVEPEQLAVTDAEGNVVTPDKPAVTRQAVHRVPVTEDVEETVEIPAKTERRPTGTQTKSVKYSILYMKAVKALQEAMERIETLEAEVAALKGV